MLLSPIWKACRMRKLLFLLCFAGGPALADFPETVRNHILPGYAAFDMAAQELAKSADKDCTAQALRPAFNAAYDAWIGVQHLRFGPVEENGIGLSITFWPDPKGSGAKAQRALLTGDQARLQPETFAQQSIAARGLTGMERLLYPKDTLPADPCALIRATAADLARTAALINSAWTTQYAQIVLTAEQPGNTTFLTQTEVRQVLFTQVISGLEFILDQRLGRPLGTFDKPEPARAEAVASGRALINIRLSLAALRAMVETMTPDVPLTMAAFDRAQMLADGLDDPVLAGVSAPASRLKVDILHQAVSALRDTALAELGPALDVALGFNAADGD